MLIKLLLIIVSCYIILCVHLTKYIKNISKTVSFSQGMFPAETGKYYIILNERTVTVDIYQADKYQWEMTKNPAQISHYAKYEE